MSIRKGDYLENFITIFIDNKTQYPLTDLYQRFIFQCGSIQKSFEPAETIEVTFTERESMKLSFKNTAYLAGVTVDGHKHTFDGYLSFEARGSVVNWEPNSLNVLSTNGSSNCASLPANFTVCPYKIYAKFELDYKPTKVSELINDLNYQDGEQVSNAIAQHNASAEAHSYIRSLLADTTEALGVVAENLSRETSVRASETEALTIGLDNVYTKSQSEEYFASKSLEINGNPLSSDINLNSQDVGALAAPNTSGTKGYLIGCGESNAIEWVPPSVVGNKKNISIGVFGGSFATNTYAQTAYNIWIDKLGVAYKTYAVGGAGFVNGTNFVTQANGAGVHDIYVIWCSTNDFGSNRPIGTSSDVYGTDVTCWANFKEVVRICYSKNQRAKVCLLTSSPHLTKSQGNEEGRGTTSSQTNTLKEHVDAQKAMCAYYSLPCLDQYNNSQQNGFNYSIVCRSGDFHLTAYGYELMAYNQVDFLSRL